MCFFKLNINNRKNGFTLLEVMVSLTIGTICSFLMIELFLNIKTSVNFNENLLQLQQKSFVAMQIVIRDLQEAGFIGCVHLNQNMMLAPKSFNILSVNRIRGYARAQLPSNLLSLSKVVVPDSDILVISKMSDNIVPLNTINIKSSFLKNSILVIANCYGAQIVYCPFDGANAHQLLISSILLNNAEIAPLQELIFYIGNTHRISSAGQPIFALYRKDLMSEKQEQSEMVDGVESMHVLYGVRSLVNSGVQYLSTNQITHWDNVVCVQIKLVFVSDDGRFKINKDFIVALREWGAA